MHGLKYPSQSVGRSIYPSIYLPMTTNCVQDPHVVTACHIYPNAAASGTTNAQDCKHASDNTCNEEAHDFSGRRSQTKSQVRTCAPPFMRGQPRKTCACTTGTESPASMESACHQESAMSTASSHHLHPSSLVSHGFAASATE